MALLSFIILVVGGFIATAILQIALPFSFVKVWRDEEITLGFVLDQWFKRLWRKTGAGVLMCIYIFLWALLLIIPGIIKRIAYSFTLLLVAEHPRVGANQAITLSRRITYGYKWDLVIFYWSFIG